MGNRAYIVPTEFKDLRSGEIEQGLRVFDDYAAGYTVLQETETLPEDDLDLLRLALRCGDKTVREVLDFIQEMEKAINICDVWYSWEEIKDCFD